MNDFRAASGLAAWQRAPRDDLNGSGLFAIDGHDGHQHITNIRRIAGTARTPGAVLIGCGGWMLTLLAAGLLYVSYAGQYTYIYAARGQRPASAIEAGMLDIGMIIFSLLALGLARAGKPARTERALILACSIGSAAMNYAAADTASPRSVVAYTAAPVFLAIVVDRVIAVIRRHVRLDGEASPWAACGRAALVTGRLAGLAALYGLRSCLAPRSTFSGLRRALLAATPLPGTTPAPDEDTTTEETVPQTKTGQILQARKDNPGLSSSELAALLGFKENYVRTVLSRKAP